VCGIAGLYDPRASTGAQELGGLAATMAGALVHRGPDDQGTWVDEEAGIALSHRRLAVVGLGMRGHQPMCSPHGRWVVNYNGEIYNAGKLRSVLNGDGFGLDGSSDTEVLASGLEQWGIAETLERIEGMFGFAAWDRRLRRLYLVRDRFGEKPLYYGWVGRHFAFASELKALRTLPRFHLEVDRRVVAEFLRRSCVPAPSCIYQGLAQLSPGSFVSVGAEVSVGTLPAPKYYWSAHEAILRARARPLDAEPSELADQLESTLSASVAARMVADVPLGALLSGGIDSSLVVALMQRHSARAVRTFNVSFPHAAFDESTEAAAVASHLGTDHTTVPVAEIDVLAVVARMPEVWDEPFADSSQLPTLLVSEAARRSVTVALSGDGGDELFAGYNRHSWLERIWHVAGPVPRVLRSGVGAALRLAPAGAVESTARTLPATRQLRLPANKLSKLGLVLQARNIDDAYEALVSHWRDPDALVLGARGQPSGRRGAGSGFAHSELASPTEHMLWADLVTYLPNDILTKVDRAAMAVSLETRMPFLDRSVLELAWRMPPGAKLHGGVTKWIVREVLHRYVPASLVERPKMGFGVPIGSWLRSALKPWAEELLSERALRRHGLLDPAAVRRAWGLHLSGRRDLGYELWDLLMLQAWMERWGAGAAQPAVQAH
jgi:asparagine synthase (glutamine-hydrolysing)